MPVATSSTCRDTLQQLLVLWKRAGVPWDNDAQRASGQEREW